MQVRNKLYVAGQIAMCPANLAIISGGIIPQARLSLRHVRRILEAMHCGMDRLTTVICYVTDHSYIQPAHKEYAHTKAMEKVINEKYFTHILYFIKNIDIIPRTDKWYLLPSIEYVVMLIFIFQISSGIIFNPSNGYY